MKIFTVLIICLAMALSMDAQESRLDLPTQGYNSTIQESPYSTHIRIKYNHYAMTGMVIDLVSTDNVHFSVNLTNYTNCYKDTTVNMVVTSTFDKQYSYKIALDSASGTKVATYLLATRQDTISNEALAWNMMVNDCYTDIFEFKIGGRYVKQIIVCPEARLDSSKDGACKIIGNIIIPNLKRVHDQLSLDSFTYDFGNILPPGGCYTFNGPGRMCPGIKQGLTDKEWEQWDELQPYMESVHDTLKAFLEEKLTAAFSEDNYLDCPNEFYLHLSLQGKLISIATNSEIYRPDDLKHYEHCKRQLFTAFRKIKMPFINSPHDFAVMLRAVGGSVDIYPSRHADLPYLHVVKDLRARHKRPKAR